MSFGYSIGDAVMLLQLARRTYRNCKEAGGEYLEIAREIKSLYSVIRTVREEVEKPDQVLFQPGSRTSVEIMTLTDGCKGVLDEIGQLLAEHQGLAPDGEDMGAGKKLWHRLRFGNKIEDLAKVRHKIITYTSTIAVLLDTIHLKITGRVENKIEVGFADMLDRFEDMRKTILEIAAKTRAAQRSGSVASVHSVLSLSTYVDDDKEVWRRFRKELIARGFRSDALDRHMDVLKAYMMRLNQSGILDEAAMAELPSTTNPPWWAKSEFVVTTISLPVPGDDDSHPTGANHRDSSLADRSIEVRPSLMPKRSSSRAFELASRTIPVNEANTNPPRVTQAAIVPKTEQTRSDNTNGTSKNAYIRYWTAEGQAANQMTRTVATGPETGLSDTKENEQISQNETSKSFGASRLTKPWYNNDRIPPITRSQTVSFPVSGTKSMGPASLSRPLPRLTKSANDTYNPQKYIPQRQTTESPSPTKTEKTNSNTKLNALEEEEPTATDTSNTRLSTDPEDETGKKKLLRSDGDAASHHFNQEAVSNPRSVTLEPGHKSIDQDQKNQRSIPPNPTAESYYSDVESTSSHSTLLRPVDRTREDVSATLKAPLKPYVESYHTEDTISHSSHYTQRPQRENGASEGLDVGTNISDDISGLGHPTRDSVPQGDIGPFSHARMERVQAWANGLETEDSTHSNASQPRSHSLETRANRNDDDAASVSHKSVTTSRVSGPSKIQQAAKAALLAGATQAFRAATEPGSWDKKKGKSVIAAALDAGGIKDEAVRNVVQEFVAGITSPTEKESNETRDERSAPSEGPSHRTSIRLGPRQTRSPRASLDRRRTFDSTESHGGSRRGRERMAQDYSDIEDSSDEEREAKKVKGKKLLNTGLAVVSTIHAANSIYGAMAKREARRKAVEEGYMSPEEARKLKAKARLQDIASIGIATLGVKGAVEDWNSIS